MTSTTFDTLGHFDKLKAAGFSEQQARVQADALRELIDDKLATKQDIKDLRTEMKELEYRLTIRLGTMLAAGVALLAAMIVLVK